MKQIFQGLTAMQIQTTWQEIFEFREMHIGKMKNKKLLKNLIYF